MKGLKMPDGKIILNRIIIAANYVKQMVEFYNAVLDSNLKSFSAYNSTLYIGKFAGIELLICPAQIAGVTATQNRHQLRFNVDDIEKIFEQATSNGGSILTEIMEENEYKIGSVKDPDGNSIEFEQKINN